MIFIGIRVCSTRITYSITDAAGVLLLAKELTLCLAVAGQLKAGKNDCDEMP